MKKVNSKWRLVVILGLTLVMITWVAGTKKMPLFDWDELNFAEIGREMLETGNFLQPTINYQPFHEKPPLFAWLQVVSSRIFGVNSLGARFPNVLCGFLSLILLWRWGSRLKDSRFGLWWAAFMGLSILPALYFRSGIIDPWFNLLILLGLFPALAGKPLRGPSILLSGLWLGLAVLTKGPAAGLIAGLCWLVLLILRPEERLRRSVAYLGTGLLALLPILLWIALLWRVDDGFFAREFLEYQWRLFVREDAGHGGFPGYHVVVLLLGCFPASVFAIPQLWRGRSPQVQSKDPVARLDGGMRILFWVVLVLFSVVNTKIVHYSSLCYFPLAYFAARTVLSLDRSTTQRRIMAGANWIWGLYGLLALALPLLAWNLPRVLPYINEEELLARLAMPVVWPWYTLVPALVIIGGLIGIWRIRTRPLHLRAGAHLLLAFWFMTLGIPIFTPRIQQYSQGAAVTFYQDLAGQDVYVSTTYYKSYAHWFYAEIPPEIYQDGCQDRQCRFHEDLTKPLYFSSPLRKRDQVLREVPDAELLYEKGGFAFYRRPATQ